MISRRNYLEFVDGPEEGVSSECAYVPTWQCGCQDVVFSWDLPGLARIYAIWLAGQAGGSSAGSGAGDDLNSNPSRRSPSSRYQSFTMGKTMIRGYALPSLEALVKVSCSRGPEQADGERNLGTKTGASL